MINLGVATKIYCQDLNNQLRTLEGELALRENPHYCDHALDQIKCRKDNSMWITILKQQIAINKRQQESCTLLLGGWTLDVGFIGTLSIDTISSYTIANSNGPVVGFTIEKGEIILPQSTDTISSGSWDDVARRITFSRTTSQGAILYQGQLTTPPNVPVLMQGTFTDISGQTSEWLAYR